MTDPHASPDLPADHAPVAAPPRRHHWLLDTAAGCATLAVVPTAAVGAALTFLSTNVFQQYGPMVFVASPFIGGLLANALYVRRQGATQVGVVGMAWWVVAVLAILCTLALLVATALEGVICVLMATPLALLMALVGAWLGRELARWLGPTPPGRLLTLVGLLYPAGQALEATNAGPPPPHAVTTRVRIQAPAARVWRVLVRPVAYPAAVGWLFRAGVAYPTHTALEPAAGGWALRCAYSQGAARLPVTTWQPGRELTFRVPHTPPPMRELSPYPRIHAPHLHGYFRVETGTFRLRPQADGSTVLEATTVYRHSIGPRAYWELWSDYLLDDLHQRVLSTIKGQAEHE